ncbi:hypothetical protein ACHAWF_006908 [Thalassiosira exigua]
MTHAHHHDALHVLADVVARDGGASAPADGPDVDEVVLTQPPEVSDGGTSTTASGAMPPDADGDPPTTTTAAAAEEASDPPPPPKRKSKLKKSARRSPPRKSVLEGLSSEAGVDAGRGEGRRTSPRSKAHAGGRASPSAASSSASSSPAPDLAVGTRVEVYWPDDDVYYPGSVTARPGGSHHEILYDDGESEVVDLSTEKFRVLEPPGGAASSPPPSSEAAIEAVGGLTRTLEGLVRRRKEGQKGGKRKGGQGDDYLAEQILAVLCDLAQRDDVDYRVLVVTQVGKVVGKLAKKPKKKKKDGTSDATGGMIADAATPLLLKWKAIDQSTPAKAKAAVRKEVAAAANADGGGKRAGEARKTAVAAPATPAPRDRRNKGDDNDAIDLTDSPSPSKVQSDARRPPPSSGRRRGSSAAAKVTPASVRGTVGPADGGADGGTGSPPSPPELEISSSLKENDGASPGRKPKRKDRAADAAAAAPLKPRQLQAEQEAKPTSDAEPAKQKKDPAPSKQTKKSSDAKPVAKPPVKRKKEPIPAKQAKQSRDSQPAANPPGKKRKESADAKSAARPNDAQPDPAAKPAAAATAPASKKRKKRSFHDEILYVMLTTCKPYTLKSLAKATNTTVEALNHAMLSFLDKRLVICKEFPSKNGNREPKKLYWANPMSAAEVEAGGDGKKGKKGGAGGGGVVAREFSKLLSAPAEVEEARELLRRMEGRRRALQEELTPLLAIPTMTQLDDGIAAEERKLREAQDEVAAVKERVANASKRTAEAPGPGRGAGYNPYNPANRFRKPPIAPQSPRTLKRRINHMLGEYKARKRKCMDFVEELSDAMEKKTKDVLGDKVLGLDTDELEWGQYKDGTTGKVYGMARPKMRRGLLGGRIGGPGGSRGANDDGSEGIVKIPAKYKDV